MNVTQRKRTWIVRLSKHTVMNRSVIAKLVGVNQGTVSHIVEEAAESVSLAPKQKVAVNQSDRQHQKVTVSCCTIEKKNPTKTSDKLKNELASTEVQVSLSTVSKRPQENGRQSRRLLKNQLLTASMRSKMYKWALKHKNCGEN